jgi:Ca2+-binding EF-hand superfamily protein
LKKGKFDEALADANNCIKLKPGFHKGYGRKGAAYHAMKKYDRAVAAYKEGLKICPDEEHLKMGLAAAKRAKVDSSKGNKAVQKSEATRRAATSRKKKTKKATSVSSFVKQTRAELKTEMAALQSQLDLINELAAMTDVEKLDLLFTLVDRDGDGTVDAKELAGSMRKRNSELSFGDSLERAINMVAVFDQDGDAKLDHDEFGDFVDVMTKELGTDFHEFAEFLVLQLVFSDSGNTLEEEIAGELAAADINEAVKKREELFDMLVDPRMIELFKLFDKDGSRVLTFKEVACGLYQVTANMEESVRTTMNLLLMMDKNDTRTLNYEQFGRLIMGIVASAATTFDEIADELTMSMMEGNDISDEDLATLIVADEETDGEKEADMDALSYNRLQKLFDLWDDDGNGDITFQELVGGLKKFQKVIEGPDNAEETAQAMVGFDEDGDGVLGRKEFANAMQYYSKVVGVELHDLIDFMCITALGDDENLDYQDAYKQSVVNKSAIPKMKDVSTDYFEDDGDDFEEE